MFAPWNAMWSEDDRYEVRPCRHAGGQLAIWQPQTCKGFARPNMVRQRKSIAELVCTVCGLPTAVNDRWWFALGEYMTDANFEEKPWTPVTRQPFRQIRGLRKMDIIISSVATYGLFAVGTMAAVVAGFKLQKKPINMRCARCAVISGAVWPLTLTFAIFGRSPPKETE